MVDYADPSDISANPQEPMPGTPELRKKGKRRDDEEILKEAKERYEDASDRDRKNIEDAKSDTKFVYIAGEQWDPEVKRRWGDDPVLEFPQLKQFVNQVVNDQRQNRPGIRIHPAGPNSSDKTAEILQGHARNIEYDCNAEAIYDNGFQSAVVGGRGFWRWTSEYENEMTFDQKLKLCPINDASTVRIDLDYQEPDASDMNFIFVEERLTKEQFEKRWPDADAVSWQPNEDNADWYNGKDEIVIADYYRRTCTKRVLVMMSDGNKGWKDQMPKGIMLPPDVTIIAERESDVYAVEWFKIAGGEQILEEYDWPGKTIPVVMCVGDTIIIDGKRVFQGLIRQAKDAQRMYNYEKSMKALHLSLGALAPWIAAEGQIEGYEEIWRSANKTRHSVLPYKQTDYNGQPAPPPQRAQPMPIQSGWAEAAQSDKEDIKSIIGMYQNSLGMHSQEVSGRAILAREKQGDNSTFHFADNMSRAIALTGRIYLEVVGTFYDEERIITTISDDDTRMQVTVNQQHQQYDPVAGMWSAIKGNDLSQGDYAVTVESGPSYATAREQTRDYMMQLVQSDPQILAIGGDIIVKAMDFPDADKLAERMQAMMPPPIQQLLQADKAKMGQGGPPDPAQLMQQVQEMSQQLQQAQQMMQQAQQHMQELESGQQAKMAQVQSDEKVAVARLQSEEQLAQMRIASEERIAVERGKSAERVAEIKGNADLMKTGLTAIMTPIPDALPEDNAPPMQ
jgi:DNA-binding ferritin-like protein